MSQNTICWKWDRPQLTVERTGGGMISRCYEWAGWKITSTYRLKKETILSLFQLGVIGFGQEFSVKSPCDGKEPPAGHDTVECVELDRNGVIVASPALNPYSDLPYESKQFPYFEYLCESKCDSGD